MLRIGYKLVSGAKQNPSKCELGLWKKFKTNKNSYSVHVKNGRKLKFTVRSVSFSRK
jgi:hypothetical protein